MSGASNGDGEGQARAPSPRLAMPAAGTTRVRVRYCECDPMGVAHHAAYWPWLEMARTELLRDAGVSYAELEACGVYLVIVKIEGSYKVPAYYDDLLEIRTRVVGGSRIKLRHEYDVVRVEHASRAVEGGLGTGGGSGGGGGGIVPVRLPRVGDLVMTASSLLACVDKTGRPTAMPDWLTPKEAS